MKAARKSLLAADRETIRPSEPRVSTIRATCLTHFGFTIKGDSLVHASDTQAVKEKGKEAKESLKVHGDKMHK